MQSLPGGGSPFVWKFDEQDGVLRIFLVKLDRLPKTEWTVRLQFRQKLGPKDTSSAGIFQMPHLRLVLIQERAHIISQIA